MLTQRRPLVRFFLVGARAASAARREGFRKTDVTEYLVEMGRSLQLDARELDHLGPFLGVFGDKPAEIGWRAYKRCAP